MTVTRTLTTTCQKYLLNLILILDPHFPNLYTESSNSKKPGAEGEVGPEDEDEDGGGDQQEQANSQGLKYIFFFLQWPGLTTPDLVWFGSA